MLFYDFIVVYIIFLLQSLPADSVRNIRYRREYS